MNMNHSTLNDVSSALASSVGERIPERDETLALEVPAGWGSS